jgi:thioredoxin 1
MSNFNDYIAGDVPVLVEFFASWCPHCQRMMPRVEELKQRMGSKLKVVQLDIDSPANQQAVRHFGIPGVPTFILFHRGKQRWQESGEHTVDQLVQAVQEYA